MKRMFLPLICLIIIQSVSAKSIIVDYDKSSFMPEAITSPIAIENEGSKYIETSNDVSKMIDADSLKITCTNFYEFDINRLPDYALHEGVSVSGSCGGEENVIIYLIDEEYYGLDETPDSCPDSLKRIYSAYDICGNFSDTCTQTFTFLKEADCQICIDDPYTSDDDVPFFPVIFDNPDATWTSPNVVRNGICCYAEGPPLPRCVSFNVYLHEDAVGLIFDIPTGAIPGGALYYHIDCGPPQKVGNFICLAGDRYYTLTFCEPGMNPNTYFITSISGAVTTEELVTCAYEECKSPIGVNGLEPNTITWTVKSPNDQTLLRYLDLTDPEYAVFTPDSITPSNIIYEVCGQLGDSNLCDGFPIYDCADITVTTLADVKTVLNELSHPGLDKVKCYPNPFREEVVIEIIPETDAEIEMQIEVLNQFGQQVKILDSEKVLSNGIYKLEWNGRNSANQQVSSGIYYVSIKLGNEFYLKKVVYNKID